MVPRDTYLDRLRFHGVVASTEFSGVEEDAKDLDIVSRRNAGDDDTGDEEADASRQRMKKRENGAADDKRDEEQSPLRTQHGQWAVHRFINFVSP
jgi:hypothetical protein